AVVLGRGRRVSSRRMSHEKNAGGRARSDLDAAGGGDGDAGAELVGGEDGDVGELGLEERAEVAANVAAGEDDGRAGAEAGLDGCDDVLGEGGLEGEDAGE